MTFSSQAMTFSASLLSADAEDPSRSGYPSGAVFSSPEALDHNSVFLDYHRRAFARWRLSPIDKRLSSRGTPFAHCRAFRATLQPLHSARIARDRADSPPRDDSGVFTGLSAHRAERG